MPIYNLTYPILGQQLLPPDKRNTRLIAFVTCMLAPLQWLRDLWMGTYRTGETAFDPSIAYKKYDHAVYQKIVYQSLQNSNIANTPLTTPLYWQPMPQNFIGLSERLLYNGQILTLTWAMNKWFGTTFVQPPSTSTSGIYISNNAVATPVFIVGQVESNSSDAFSTTSTEFVVNGYSFVNQINFTINVPVAVYNALDAAKVNNDKIFRSFVDQYLPAGITYQITTY